MARYQPLQHMCDFHDNHIEVMLLLVHRCLYNRDFEFHYPNVDLHRIVIEVMVIEEYPNSAAVENLKSIEVIRDKERKTR